MNLKGLQAHRQQGGNLLRLPGERVNDGHDIVGNLVLTGGEMEHAEEWKWGSVEKEARGTEVKGQGE